MRELVWATGCLREPRNYPIISKMLPVRTPTQAGSLCSLHCAGASPLRVQGYSCWDGSERSLDTPESIVA